MFCHLDINLRRYFVSNNLEKPGMDRELRKMSTGDLRMSFHSKDK